MRSTIVLLAMLYVCSWPATQVASNPRPVQEDAAAPKRTDDVTAPQGQAPSPSPAAITKTAPEELEAKRGTEKGDRSKKGEPSEKDFWYYANALSTIAIAAFTFFLVLFGRLQAAATTKSVCAMEASTRVANAALTQAKEAAAANLEETRRANVLSLRPWLLVKTIKTTDLANVRDDSPPVVSVAVKNYGRLPAIRVTIHRYFEISHEMRFEPPLPDTTRDGGRIIAAGQFYRFPLRLDTQRHAELMDEMREMGGALMLRLKILYTDALDTDGEANYVFHYSQSPSPHFVEWTLRKGDPVR